MICTVHFELNDTRVTRLERAGVNSIRALFKVLAALDLEARVELEAATVPLPTHPKDTP